MFSKFGIRAGFFSVLGALFLAACTVVVEDPPPPIPGPDGPTVCTQIYDPVCGRRAGDRETFGNACLARAEGYRIIHEGQCRRDRDRPEVCTRIYDPVCARRGNRVRTFGNACEARSEGYRVIDEGRC